MHILAVGRMRSGPEAELFARYRARLATPLTLTEIPEQNGPPADMHRRENLALRAALPAHAFVVALDLAGHAPDSAAFASQLAAWCARQAPLYFVIGGADGLDAATLARANATLSLGNLTWPHLLARVLLVEQLYRAQTIRQGHPYHRARRPT